MADEDEAKCSILKMILDLGLQAVELYETLSSLTEVFSPLNTNIRRYYTATPHVHGFTYSVIISIWERSRHSGHVLG